jgi:deazaflavin-dependent oxidoreductase (nitroreductase family)
MLPASFANSLKKTKPSSSSKASSSPAPGTASEREDYLYLTTRGRRSGLPREIEIWFTHRDGRFYVIAEHAGAHWVHNVRAYSAVQVRIAGKSFAARARIVSAQSEPELNRAVQQLSSKKYGWGDGLVVELLPEMKSDPCL